MAADRDALIRALLQNQFVGQPGVGQNSMLTTPVPQMQPSPPVDKAAARIAGDNRFVSNLQKQASEAARQHILSLIPPPTSVAQRAVHGTRGLSQSEIMSSEPLWGYSSVIADQLGQQHHEAFANLANHIFASHGIKAAQLTPNDAKGFMQMERLRYGQNPSGE